MKITILGCNGPYPAKNGACSGYLIQNGNKNIIIDMGPGVLESLQNFVKPWEIDALIISHLHYDHFSDLYAFRYCLDMAFFLGYRKEKVILLCPSEPEFERNTIKNSGVFEEQALNQNTIFELGDITFKFFLTKHPIPCYGIIIECSGKKICISSDTMDFEELENHAKDSDLFICEALYYQEDIDKGYPNHMSSREGAIRAKNAGAKKLLLTHLNPEIDKDRLLKEGKEVFPETFLLQKGDVFII